MKHDKKLPKKGKVDMKEFEGTKADLKADRREIRKINQERKKSGKK